MKNNQHLNPGFVMSTSGQCLYSSPDGESGNLAEGMIVFADGEIELKKDAKAKIFYNGKSILVNKDGKHPLKSILVEDHALQRGFPIYFEDALTLALSRSKDGGGQGSIGWGRSKDGGGQGSIGWGRSKDGGGQGSIGWGRSKDGGGQGSIGWGRSKDGGGQGSIGWGSSKDRVFALSPEDCPVSESKTSFFWTAQDGIDHYEFQLFLPGSDEPDFKKAVEGSAIMVDLESLGAREGNKLAWQVTAAGKPLTSKAHFTLRLKSEKKAETLQKVRQEPIYKDAGTPERMLMEAVALDRAGLSHDAFMTYLRAAEKFKDNQLVQRMYESYVRRMVEE